MFYLYNISMVVIKKNRYKNKKAKKMRKVNQHKKVSQNKKGKKKNYR